MNLYLLNINPDYEDWFLNQEEHRINGPARIWYDRDQYWYQNGLYHRDDGPATIYYNGKQYWYLNNQNYTEQNYLNEIAKLRAIIK